jgi:hypothetical protein
MTTARHELIDTQRPEVPPRLPAAQLRERPRLQASINLVALPSAVTVARLFVASTLRRWGALFIEPEMASVATELVATAIDETGPGTVDWAEIRVLNPITVNLVGYPRHILIEVADVHPYETPAPGGIGIEKGLGHPVVDAPSRRGAYPAPWGRVVWAEFAVRERTEAGTPQRVHKLPPNLRTTPRSQDGSRGSAVNCGARPEERAS